MTDTDHRRELIENEHGYLCTWCGDEVTSVKEPTHPGERMIGTCDKDGIVYLTLDPDEVSG